MTPEETVDAIEKMLESFILPDLKFIDDFKVEYGASYHGVYDVTLYINVDVTKVFMRSPDFDKEYSKLLYQISDWDILNDIRATLKKYLGITQEIYTNLHLEYENLEPILKEKEELEKQILELSEKKGYDLKDLWVDVWLDHESFNIRLDIGGELANNQDEFETDISELIANNSEFGHLQDVIDLYGDISFWLNN
jgi:hypothetical protein